MDKGEGGDLISEVIGGIFSLLGALFEEVMEILPTVISFVSWCLIGIIVLPCVYVAGNIYPTWVKWGEEL